MAECQRPKRKFSKMFAPKWGWAGIMIALDPDPASATGEVIQMVLILLCQRQGGCIIVKTITQADHALG